MWKQLLHYLSVILIGDLFKIRVVVVTFLSCPQAAIGCLKVLTKSIDTGQNSMIEI